MQLEIESNRIEDFLLDSEVINYSHPLVQQKINDIVKTQSTKQLQVEAAFYFVRDEISHSFDRNSSVVTISASETMKEKDGICFAKAHLLAALLRGMGIPTGFCYQRVTRKGTPESGYALHGLNAVYLDGKWIRLDPRGNKPGIASEFSVTNEKLAYPIREELDEVDYPYVYSAPLKNVIAAMLQSENCQALFYNRPSKIDR